MRIPYRRTSDFSTTKPEELRRDLQQMDRYIEDTFRSLESPQRWNAVRKTSSSTTAQFGEMLVCDTTDGSIVVTLPRAALANPLHAGDSIMVVRVAAANALTLQCVGADEINGASSKTLGASGGVRALIGFDGAGYWAS